METVRYSVAIKTYMEVFDYLINNNLFVYDSENDFLKARIKIGKYGFVEEIQKVRGTWDDEYPNERLVPAIYVLYILTKNIDEILKRIDIPTSSKQGYAYINDVKAKISNDKIYYNSYQELLSMLEDIKLAQDSLFYSDGKVIDFNLIKLRELRKQFLRLTTLEKGTIECYARLEEELVNYTSALLMVDESILGLRRGLLDKPNMYFVSSNFKVNWVEFKDCLLDNYLYQKEENGFDMYGIYSLFEHNPYKSVLGLDGKTK